MKVKPEHFGRASQVWKDPRCKHAAFDPQLCEVIAEMLAHDSGRMDEICAENAELKKKFIVEDFSASEFILTEPDGIERAVNQALQPGGMRMGPGETIPSNYQEKRND